MKLFDLGAIMARKKKQKSQATESAAEFVARLAKQDAKVNGLKRRFGFGTHSR